MNYTYYKQLRRKELTKTFIFTVFILLFASFSTYYIYDKFEDSRDFLVASDSLEVVFHDASDVSITKITPVSDSVGLSSKAYTFTIKNNTMTKVRYKVKVVSDTEKIQEDDCSSFQAPLNIIKTGIHKEGEVSTILNLDDLEDGEIVTDYLAPQREVKYTLRFWVSQNTLSLGNHLHFHGKIKVVED